MITILRIVSSPIRFIVSKCIVVVLRAKHAITDKEISTMGRVLSIIPVISIAIGIINFTYSFVMFIMQSGYKEQVTLVREKGIRESLRDIWTTGTVGNFYISWLVITVLALFIMCFIGALIVFYKNESTPRRIFFSLAFVLACAAGFPLMIVLLIMLSEEYPGLLPIDPYNPPEYLSGIFELTKKMFQVKFYDLEIIVWLFLIFIVLIIVSCIILCKADSSAVILSNSLIGPLAYYVAFPFMLLFIENVMGIILLFVFGIIVIIILIMLGMNIDDSLKKAETRSKISDLRCRAREASKNAINAKESPLIGRSKSDYRKEASELHARANELEKRLNK